MVFLRAQLQLNCWHISHKASDFLVCCRAIRYSSVRGKFVTVTTKSWRMNMYLKINRLTPNDPYMGRTAPLTSKRCILYIYSTSKGTEYFKHALYSPFFSLQNAVCFIMLTCLVPVLITFYIQSVLKLKKNNSGAKGLMPFESWRRVLW